jgi:hypothetical protein
MKFEFIIKSKQFRNALLTLLTNYDLYDFETYHRDDDKRQAEICTDNLGLIKEIVDLMIEYRE